MIIVRYADDFIVGFQREADARRFWDDIMLRLKLRATFSRLCDPGTKHKLRLPEDFRQKAGHRPSAAWRRGVPLARAHRF
jgi:hypothetical protein